MAVRPAVIDIQIFVNAVATLRTKKCAKLQDLADAPESYGRLDRARKAIQAWAQNPTGLRVYISERIASEILYILHSKYNWEHEDAEAYRDLILDLCSQSGGGLVDEYDSIPDLISEDRAGENPDNEWPDADDGDILALVAAVRKGVGEFTILITDDSDFSDTLGPKWLSKDIAIRDSTWMLAQLKRQRPPR